MTTRRALVLMMGAAFAGVEASAQEALTRGDWVGQVTIHDSAMSVRARFTAGPSGLGGTIDLPRHGAQGLPLLEVRLVPPRLGFAFVFRGDTLRFEGRADPDSLRVAGRSGSATLVHRIAPDSAALRRLAGNYRIGPDRVISMGPLDEAGGWLSFFDSQTRRGGILYAMSDTVLFTGPSFGVDYPIGILALVRSDAGGHIRGLTWTEHGAEPREAARLDDVLAEDVTFLNGGVRLAGTVTVPKGGERHPAVILIHGAGRTVPTRDFGYWSSYFAGHGIAVLSFDKRGGGGSGGDANTATYEDLADDVLAGLGYLQSRPDIAPDRIGVFGTSNGGYIAPLAANRSAGRIAFIAVRSGSARVVGNNIAYEVGNDLRSEGFSEAEVARAVAIRQRVTDFVLSHPDITGIAWDSLKAEVAAVAGEAWYPWSRVLWVPLVSPSDRMAVAYLDKLRSEWRFGPMPYWRRVRVPAYVMLGGLDRAVPTAESARLLRDAFASAGNPDATVRVFDRGNHGLLEAETGYEREAWALNRYVEGFQDGLMRWITARVGGAPAR
jgi:hypothetical protein